MQNTCGAPFSIKVYVYTELLLAPPYFPCLSCNRTA